MNLLEALAYTTAVQPPSTNHHVRHEETKKYVEILGCFLSGDFQRSVAELLRHHYPHHQKTLLDEILACFVSTYPEHARDVFAPIAHLVVDGALVYNKHQPPFHVLGTVFSLPSAARERAQQHVARASFAALRSLAEPYGNAHVAGGSSGLLGLVAWMADCLLLAPPALVRHFTSLLVSVAIDLDPKLLIAAPTALNVGPGCLRLPPQAAASLLQSLCEDEMASQKPTALTFEATRMLLLYASRYDSGAPDEPVPVKLRVQGLMEALQAPARVHFRAVTSCATTVALVQELLAEGALPSGTTF
ncbi:hypothetical protein CYMTET_53998 [Cymbomonas tetramitiformis]|uniref:Uncharacterized protein n=1 Tax=Cymbomonas tetramitiformis TaxID=36881 RepID=A0AAE0EPT9_9CHLO|nr:hypothetical protein CYMTET_53998 [Cymbomonas tetramitiformis]